MSVQRKSTLTPSDPHDGSVLPGLDGTNPLGFLAALGLFRILDLCSDPGTMGISWLAAAGTWVPVLHHQTGVLHDETAVLDALADRLTTTIESHPANVISQLDEVASDEAKRRNFLQEIAEGSDHTRLAWTAAIASNFAAPDSINQLQTTRRDYFLGNLTSVLSRTTREHLRRAIFHHWDYADALDNQSLHLDPSEDRRHAHQWNKPAGDPDRKLRGGMLGANRLALEAIPLFPSIPESNTLRTVGFTGTRSTNTRWTWPVWHTRLSLPVMRSLLCSTVLQSERLGTAEIEALKEWGVVAAYRTRRILVGKTPNFTPAQRIA